MKELLKNFRQPACDETIYYCLNELLNPLTIMIPLTLTIIYYTDQW